MMTRLTAAQIRELLHLEPHPIEGGFFIRTYASPHKIPQLALPPGFQPGQAGSETDRLVGTAIYYLLTPETFSALHRLPGDEIFHFYLGDPVELLELRPDGTTARFTLGQDLASGMKPQHVVPGGVWQGSRLLPGGEYALLGTTMAPGFDYADYETGSRDQLIAKYPAEAERIRALTR
jgi:predicted cupin superfamily sugar epimerase